MSINGSNRTLKYTIDFDTAPGRASLGSFRKAVSSEIGDIGRDFASGAGRVGAFAASLGPVGLALGATAGILVGVGAGLTVATQKAVALGSSFNDLSLETGLSVETLSGLSDQLIQSGTNAQALGNAVLFLHKNLGQAAEGNKELQATFRELGITDFDAALKDTDGTLRTVIRSLGELTDVGERDRLGSEALGRAYKELRVFIADTGGDIEETLRRAREAGVIMSTEVAGNLDALGDSWDRLSNRAMVTSANFIGIVAPEITKALDDIGSALSVNVTDWEQWALGAAVSAARVRGVMEGAAKWWNEDSWSPWKLGKDIEQGAQAAEIGAMTDFLLNKSRPPEAKAPSGRAVARRGGGGKGAGKDKAAERERKEIEGELRDEAELHRAFTDELQRAYARRIFDLAEYVRQTKEGLETHFQIQKQNYDLEEALIRRTVKDKGEQTEKLADLDRKRAASLREYEKGRQKIEDEEADKRHAAAEAKADSLLKIDEAVARRRIAAIEGVANLGIKRESEAAAEIGRIQLDLFDKQTARLRARLVQEEEGSAGYKRIQGELGEAEVNRAALIEAVARRVELAKKAEVEAERQRLEELRRLRAQARSEGIELEKGFVEFGAREDEYRTRAERLGTIRQLADLERRAERERNAQELAEIEDKRRINLERAKTERERVEALKAYHEQVENEERRHQLELANIGLEEGDASEAEDPFKSFKDLWGDFKDNSENADDSISSSVEGMAETVVGSLGAMESALKSSIAASVLYGDSIGLALKKALAAQLANLSAEFTVQGVKHAAYALGSLAFGDFGGAAKHAAASAAFFAGAALTGKLGSSLAKSAGMHGTGAAAGSAVASTADNPPKNQTFNYGGDLATPASTELSGGSRGGTPLARVMARIEEMRREQAAINSNLNGTLSRIQSMPAGQVVTMGAPEAREAIGVAVLQESGANGGFNDQFARNLRVP